VSVELETDYHLLQPGSDDGRVDLRSQIPRDTDFLKLLGENSVLFTFVAVS
jgi:hypothetical protein